MRQYKDSGIEWIGEIPETWIKTEVKRLCQKITDGSHFSPQTQNEGKVYITVSNVYNDKVHVEEAAKISNQDFENLVANGCQPPVGAVLLSKDGTVGRTAIVDNNDYVVLSSLGILCPSSHVLSKYLKYLLDSESLQAQMRLAMAGSALRRITITKINNLVGLLPSLPEQQRITNYLDEKCGEIDSLIGLQEQMIEKLKAYKQSVITEAVTKGLDPNAKLAPSGIDWIGVIPEGWNITVLRRFANIILGKMLQPNARSENDSIEQYICAKDVHFEGIDTSDLKKMYFNKTEKEIYQVQKGDLLVVEGGAGAAGSCVLKTDLPNTYIQNSIMIVRPKQGIDIRYIHYFEFSLVKKGYVDYVCNKATIPHFTKDKLSSMPIPLPPLSEQQAIASYLDEKCADIDRLITLKQRKIEKLKDYKKSVIYEAVTGKTIIE